LFLFFTGATTPAPPINPQCNNQPVVFIFLPFEGERGQACNLLYLFFPFWKGKWENAMLMVCHKKQRHQKNKILCFPF